MSNEIYNTKLNPTKYLSTQDVRKLAAVNSKLAAVIFQASQLTVQPFVIDSAVHSLKQQAIAARYELKYDIDQTAAEGNVVVLRPSNMHPAHLTIACTLPWDEWLEHTSALYTPVIKAVKRASKELNIEVLTRESKDINLKKWHPGRIELVTS